MVRSGPFDRPEIDACGVDACSDSNKYLLCNSCGIIVIANHFVIYRSVRLLNMLSYDAFILKQTGRESDCAPYGRKCVA